MLNTFMPWGWQCIWHSTQTPIKCAHTKYTQTLSIHNICIIYISIYIYTANISNTAQVASLRAGRSGDRIRVGARFSAPVPTSPGAHPASCTMGTRSLPGVKRPRRGVDHPLSSNAEVKERIELYLYSPLDLHDLFWGEFYLYLHRSPCLLSNSGKLNLAGRGVVKARIKRETRDKSLVAVLWHYM